MKIAILDLDGTLIDSSYRHVKLLVDVINKLGKNISEEDVKDYLSYKADGHSTLDYLTEVMGLEHSQAEEIALEWSGNIENIQYMSTDKFYDDAYTFVKGLKDAGYDIYALTARQNKDYIIGFVNGSKLRDYITYVFVVDPFKAKEEKLDVIKGHFPDSENQLVMVGDTGVDYETGVNAGAKTFILNRGFRSKAYWDNKGIKSYDNLGQVMEAIREL